MRYDLSVVVFVLLLLGFSWRGCETIIEGVFAEEGHYDR
jgi:hypothetical protein